MHLNNNVRIVDSGLVNKILEQGQKLRNAMVGSILKNDPFNTDIIYSKQTNTPKTCIGDLKIDNPITSIDEKRLEAYIKGDYMTKDEERLVLDTLRSISAPDLCKTTERTLNSNCSNGCKCYTCEIYNSNNLYCDLRRKNEPYEDGGTPSNELGRDMQEKYNNENRNLLKYVDSLKVSINNLTLNETGNRKVWDDDNKAPYNFRQMYFLEYNIPDSVLIKTVNKSKVNSGRGNSCVRFCSRRSNDAINFKQTTIHDIKNLSKCNLYECEIKFKISYRTQKQKNVFTLGFAKFNLDSFLLSKNLVCSRNLPVYLNEISPIIVGNLKVSLSLGCGRLYFGHEFVDAINSVNRESIILDSDDSTNQLNKNEPCNINLKNSVNIKEHHTYQHTNDDENNKQIAEESISKRTASHEKFKKQEYSASILKPASKLSKQNGHEVECFQNVTSENNNYKPSQVDKSKTDQIVCEQINDKLLKPQISENEKQVLFGFLYISEVQYLSLPINSYITCRPFCQNETSCSKVITDSANPIFNFAQVVPLIYEDELLQLFRENYMVVEIWKKVDVTDAVIGLAKIPLHQFYLAYRNPVFLKYLSKNKLPVIDTDWWEPIYSVDTGKILGQVQLLVALGTEDQINNLKIERGFADNVVKAKFSSSEPVRKIHSKPTEHFNGKNELSAYKSKYARNANDFLQLKNRTRFKLNTDINSHSNNLPESLASDSLEKDQVINCADKAVNTSPKTGFNPHIHKSDIGTQSNLEMDTSVETPDKDKTSPTQEMLGNFLNQLMAQKQKNICVENSTNTDLVETARSNCSQSLQNAQHSTNLKLRQTTDLLDSLQKALTLDNQPGKKIAEKKPGTFKACITIESGNNLPSRKKCKSKRSRNRSVKNEDNVLPSCYVTFETAENDLRMTPVVMNSPYPTWNYKCNVYLLKELLNNSQRRLIFKVWRKATNTVLSPNMQTDVVLGFAALDLTILLAGFPCINGWFNIIDFTGKCNGQIKINITPLEDLSKYSLRKEECNCKIPPENIKSDQIKLEDEPSELFSRALKRKFTELDEITQRLRLRLSKVTNDDSDTSSDEGAEEFEADINTLCIEEDFDLIDFEEEARKLNLNYKKDNVVSSDNSSASKLRTLLTVKENGSKADENVQTTDGNKTSSSNTATSLSQEAGSILGLSSSSDKEKELLTLDQHLQEGKQKIDTLLEKLSLISAETNNTFASRYVSGCSLNNDGNNAINIDTEAILKELDHSSRPNIQSALGFEPLKFQQLYGGSYDSNSSKKSGGSTSQTSNSDTSLITNFSEGRPAPDGQGNILDDNVVKK